MKILDDEPILKFLDSANDSIAPMFKIHGIQVHLDFKCGCKITQDKMGNSLFPCQAHKDWANRLRADGVVLHRRLH